MNYPSIHIIHLPHRIDRMEILAQELAGQEIREFQIWHGILDQPLPSRGVAKAHKRIVQFAKDNQLPSIVIAEDEIKFSASGAYGYFLEMEPAVYDLYLGGISYGSIQPDGSVKDFGGLFFYSIRQNFYDNFLAIPENGHLDRNLAGKGKFMVCNPFTVTQHNGFSDNKKEWVDYEIYFKDRPLFGSGISKDRLPLTGPYS